MKSATQQHFVSEVIMPITATADINAMAAGGPGLPKEFRWREQTLTIARVLRTWRETGPCTHGGSGGSELYARKHWFEVETVGNGGAKIYFERQNRSRGVTRRWWLFSIEKLEHH